MIVRRKEVNLSEPGVPSPVAYRHMRRWQRRGVKLPGQSNLVRKSAADGRETEGGDSEHPMESGGEAARQGQQMRIVATVVKRTKPKGADRLEPKGTWSAVPLFYSGHMDAMTTGGKTGPKPRVSFRRNAVNPYRRP